MTGAADEVAARVVLARVAEPGDGEMGRWLERVGAPRAVEALAGGRCPLRRAEAYLARFARADADADLTRAAALGARAVVPGDPGWPTQLDDLGPTRPILLWTRGPVDLRLSALCSVAIVGSRAATRYGEDVAVDLAAGVASAGWTVVSGGAYGIDAAAHRGALAVDGITIAVLANGIDTVYPRGNDSLLSRVLDAGLLVTELGPGEHPTRSRFLERNRVIAALSRATVVVESARRSGALNTAARAGDLGRLVLAVPGPVTSATSAGSHALLRDQRAALVTGAPDVLELVAPLDAAADRRGSEHDSAERLETVRELDRLGPDLKAVHASLGSRRPRDAEDIAIRAGVPAAAVLGLLGELGLRGLAVRVEGGWRVVRQGA